MQFQRAVVLAGLLVGLLAGVLSNLAWSENRPNFLLVFIGDLGWGDFSCFGNRRATIATIDPLAGAGIRFEPFYVNSPICSPSRVAISTGQYPQRWRIGSYLSGRRENQARGIADWLDPSAPMLARMLQRAGYCTGQFGKWHVGGQRDVGDAPQIHSYGFDASLTNFEGLGPRVLPICDSFDGKPPRRHALGSEKLGKGPIQWRDRSQISQVFTSAAIEFIRQAESENVPFYVNLWPLVMAPGNCLVNTTETLANCTILRTIERNPMTSAMCIQSQLRDCVKC